MYADLHFHSLCSDGKHSVPWLAKTLNACPHLGLAILTDHDGVDGFEELSGLIEKPWKPVRACELSVFYKIDDTRDQELHLLIYGISQRDEFLNSVFERFRKSREIRFKEICDRLEIAGYPVDAQSFIRDHPGRLGRPHVADALIRAGHVHSRREAFERFLYSGSSFLVDKWRLDIHEVLRHCTHEHYPTSLAHPGIYRLDRLDLEKLKEMGLTAIEVFHPKHSPQEHQKYQTLAHNLGLKISGGSDFHDAEVDKRDGVPSLGRTQYPLSAAEDFLADVL
jgi:predicted metal-dependent phosphoesterase TrpH